MEVCFNNASNRTSTTRSSCCLQANISQVIQTTLVDLIGMRQMECQLHGHSGLELGSASTQSTLKLCFVHVLLGNVIVIASC